MTQFRPGIYICPVWSDLQCSALILVLYSETETRTLAPPFHQGQFETSSLCFDDQLTGSRPEKTGFRLAPARFWSRRKNQLHQRMGVGSTWPQRPTTALFLRASGVKTSWNRLTARRYEERFYKLKVVMRWLVLILWWSHCKGERRQVSLRKQTGS